MATSSFLQLPENAQLGIADTSAQFPAWYQTYQQLILGKGSSIAGADFQQYPGQQLMDPTGNGNLTRGWESIYNMPDYAGSTMSVGGDMLSRAYGMSAKGAAQPYLDQAGATDAVGAAKPYIEGGTGKFTGSNVSDYMAPFLDPALEQQRSLLTRNLTENILPQINSSFTGSGSFGSSRQADFTGRAIRDTQKQISDAATNLQTGAYGQSGQLFGADQSRQLGAASTIGGLTAQQAGLKAQLGELSGNLEASDANRLSDMSTKYGGLTQLAQAQRIGGAGAQTAAGNEQMGYAQKPLDLQYQNWQDEQNYPLRQLAIMQSLMSGQPIPGAGTTTTTAQPGPSTSPLAQLAGLMLAGSQFYNKSK